MNKKQKKYLKILTIIIFIASGLHFVPIDTRRGYLDHGLANVCIGYGGPVKYKYRLVIKSEVDSWDEDINHLGPNNPGCSEPVVLRLYVL